MTLSEENYLKTIYHLTSVSDAEVSTNAIAEKMETKASSVTDMLRKLSEKDWINYKKYQGVSLTEKGKLAAKMIVRKHRLWEVFLVEKLHFAWDEVHDIAEQLEHIKSEQLINKLDNFLGNPTKDPHGDPIPDSNGKIIAIEKVLLSEVLPNQKCQCVGVKDSSAAFLKYLDNNKIALGTAIKMLSEEEFDLSLKIEIDHKEMVISHKIASNLYVKLI
ncbi:metal-dependent transcriptional regulator [Flavobacterium sp.]|uniref:metal-dependent transcriptional regulator n=1 Tax=Flavobacterium sp. TaxID=239 RepID=UPI002602B915|nr:metal-dependent transcriptional regulator [Flavobacterium sp.]